MRKEILQKRLSTISSFNDSSHKNNTEKRSLLLWQPHALLSFQTGTMADRLRLYTATFLHQLSWIKLLVKKISFKLNQFIKSQKVYPKSDRKCSVCTYCTIIQWWTSVEVNIRYCRTDKLYSPRPQAEGNITGSGP